jgi:hypothetical protein
MDTERKPTVPRWGIVAGLAAAASTAALAFVLLTQPASRTIVEPAQVAVEPAKQAIAPAPAAAPLGQSRGLNPGYDVTQATSCETPTGVCTLDVSLPVGAICTCPNAATGRAI